MEKWLIDRCDETIENDVKVRKAIDDFRKHIDEVNLTTEQVDVMEASYCNLISALQEGMEMYSSFELSESNRKALVEDIIDIIYRLDKSDTLGVIEQVKELIKSKK